MTASPNRQKSEIIIITTTIINNIIYLIIITTTIINNIISVAILAQAITSLLKRTPACNLLGGRFAGLTARTMDRSHVAKQRRGYPNRIGQGRSRAAPSGRRAKQDARRALCGGRVSCIPTHASPNNPNNPNNIITIICMLSCLVDTAAPPAQTHHGEPAHVVCATMATDDEIKKRLPTPASQQPNRPQGLNEPCLSKAEYGREPYRKEPQTYSAITWWDPGIEVPVRGQSRLVVSP